MAEHSLRKRKVVSSILAGGFSLGTVRPGKGPPANAPFFMGAAGLIKELGGRDTKYHEQVADIAQLGERQTEDLKVPGSIPGVGNFFAC